MEPAPPGAQARITSDHPIDDITEMEERPMAAQALHRDTDLVDAFPSLLLLLVLILAALGIVAHVATA